MCQCGLPLEFPHFQEVFCPSATLCACGGVLAPARIGEKPYFSCHGHSLIVDPWGTILAQAPDGETSLVADLDLERLERIREELPSLRNRNPAAYRWP